MAMSILWESAQVSLLGSDKQLGERRFSEDALKCEQTWRESIDELIKEQIMFHCADTTVLASAEYSVEKKAIIVPHPVAMSRKTFDVLTDLAAKGFCVIVIDFTQNLIVLEDGSRSNDSKRDVETGETSCFIVNTGDERAKSEKNYINLINPENGLCYNVDAENLVIEAKKGIIVKFGKRG